MKKLSFISLLLVTIIFLSSCRKEDLPPPISLGKDNNISEEKTYEDMMIEKMNLDEKIGQLVIVGFPPEIQDIDLKGYIDDHKVGGFILFKRNYNNFGELYELNSKLKRWNVDNPLPLFFSIDEEGGTVSRLPKDGVTMPDAALFGKINEPVLTQKSGSIIGKQLYAAGINTNFSPVLDILSNKENKLFKPRAYGRDANTVSKHGLSFIKGLSSQGIIPVAKHFPGHGDTSEDSHGVLPVVNIDMNKLENRELVPFADAINLGIDMIMVGHISFPQIDEKQKPATKSKIILTDILRNKMNFKGVALTDDIEMQGFYDDNLTLEQSILESFNAGIDIFVIGHTKGLQEKVLKILKDGINEGDITEERLNQSLNRIIKVKRKNRLSNNMPLGFDEAYDLFTNQEYIEFVENIKNKQ